MHTPEIRSHVRPAPSHPLFVVYERGEAPGYGACSLAHPAVTTVLVGADSPAQVDDAVAMATHEVPDGLWEALTAEGLLAEAAPTPASTSWKSIFPSTSWRRSSPKS